MREADVLVVGLGPAGASAAIAAARRGLSVIALERNAAPGLPVQCAEFVPLLIGAGKELNSVVDTSIQDIDKMKTYVEKSAADTTLDFRGQMIDRAKFDQGLIAQAQALGATCNFSAPVRHLRDDGVVEAGDDLLIRAKIIIGADGPRSPVAQAIGSGNRDLVGGLQKTSGMLGDTPVLLAGDAAGLTNPVTGAGINSAVISGRMAGEAAFDWHENDEHAVDDYAEELADLFGPSLERAVTRRKQVMANYLNDQKPDPADLRAGWIAYPQYWSSDHLEHAKIGATDTRESA